MEMHTSRLCSSFLLKRQILFNTQSKVLENIIEEPSSESSSLVDFIDVMLCILAPKFNKHVTQYPVTASWPPFLQHPT